MDNLLSGLFGGGDDKDERSSRARDFVNRYEQGPIDQGYDEDEAYQHFQSVSQHADPETMQRAAEQAFSRMDPQQRAEFARMLQQQAGGQMGSGTGHDPREMAGMVSQLHRQSPGGLASLFGGGGSSGHSGGGGGLGGLLGGGGGMGGTLGKVAMGGIAAYAMKELLGGSGDDDDSKRKRRSV